jgi:putative tricarboxylic transport membrane protein
MRIINSQDFAGGLLLLAFGVAGLWIGANYPMGTAQRPGTGVLPMILSWCLVGTGVLLWIKASVAASARLTPWAWRPAILVSLATVAFALLVDRLGLVLTMIVSMTLTALGTPDTRWREYLVFALLMLALGVGLFIYALGMPIPALPAGYQWN